MFKNGFCKMHTRRRSCDGTRIPGIDGLVSLSIAGFRGSLNVWREGKHPVCVSNSVIFCVETNQAAVCSMSTHLCFHFMNCEKSSGLELLPRLHHAIPAGILNFPDEEDFTSFE